MRISDWSSDVCSSDLERARQRRLAGRGTLLFVDEIHRFNRAQQDGFLPYVEDGTVILVGATTENPSFELNPALLSRCQVIVLKRLGETALRELLARGEAAEGRDLPLTPEARQALMAMADGDGRYLLNLAEEIFALGEGSWTAGDRLDTAALAEVVQKRAPLSETGQDSHYNLITALPQQLCWSDLYATPSWLARNLAGGANRA